MLRRQKNPPIDTLWAKFIDMHSEDVASGNKVYIKINLGHFQRMNLFLCSKFAGMLKHKATFLYSGWFKNSLLKLVMSK